MRLLQNVQVNYDFFLRYFLCLVFKNLLRLPKGTVRYEWLLREILQQECIHDQQIFVLFFFFSTRRIICMLLTARVMYEHQLVTEFTTFLTLTYLIIKLIHSLLVRLVQTI